uniref:Uncharacterized protein n=1 Tax=Sipha flava TaxID=143950 RepID=A0A2S2QX55_9HEMI
MVKPDIGQCPAALLYGTVLRLPGDYFHRLCVHPSRCSRTATQVTVRGPTCSSRASRVNVQSSTRPLIPLRGFPSNKPSFNAKIRSSTTAQAVDATKKRVCFSASGGGWVVMWGYGA